ncbi:hypothetical protein LCGC14_2670500, partial [marine sediment metagenome]
IPVFWSPLHFPNQPGTLGATIDADHPLWSKFPTGTHTNWQWWELLAESYAIDLAALSTRPTMPLRFIDKYNRNALPAGLFEARVGNGKLLVCTLNVTEQLDQRLAARQLRRSILTYMASDQFQPTASIAAGEIQQLFRAVRFVVKADSAHPSYRAELAVDGDPATFWHTDWTAAGQKLPAWLQIDLKQPQVITGLKYTPRADMNRGRVARYTIEVSMDGRDFIAWQKDATFPDNALPQTVTFDKPVRARFVRMVVRRSYNDEMSARQNAAVAEFEPIVETATDVRDLGIVPGFNDR